MVKPFLKSFEIQGLFGYKNILLDFQSNVKILVGENGFGKTTILNALYYLLKADYSNLQRIKFSVIRIAFDDSRKYEFSFESLKSYCRYLLRQKEQEGGLLSYLKNNVDSSVINQLLKEFEKGPDTFLNYIKKKYKEESKENSIFSHIPSEFVYEAVRELYDTNITFKVFHEISTYVNSSGYRIIYYPTYRRIEEDIKNLLKLTPSPRHRVPSNNEVILSNDSIIKFGMADVEKRIKRILEEISQSSIAGFASVSGGMISRLLESPDTEQSKHKFNLDEIKIVLSRVGDNMSQSDKDKILAQLSEDESLSQQNQFLRYFLDQLLSVYKRQEKYDQAIKNFVNVCNRYFNDKYFVYNESSVSLNIYRKNTSSNNDVIELKQLSSGEKQIISIFSQLYLELDKKFVILFDEPELSLSIYWQEKLLPDMMAAESCAFMLCVTHSPFIFDNELQKETISISTCSHE